MTLRDFAAVIRQESKTPCLSLSVKVFQLVAEGTVEDEVLAVQDRKKKLIAAAFSANRNQNQAVNDQSPPKIGEWEWSATTDGTKLSSLTCCSIEE